jgi:antitoxin HicB
MSEAMIRLHVEALEEGGYVATSADVPGLVAEGRSISEVMEIARDVARKIAESCLEHGDPLPSALSGPHDAALDLTIPVSVA